MPTRASMRLNQYLASAGLGSRRACEKLIRDGLVSINGKKISHLATQVGPQDQVNCQGRLVKTQAVKRYFIFHKPSGFVCSKRAESNYPSIYKLLPPVLHSLFYVGRLDAESEGLLLLTDDGYLAQRLTHPRYKVDKKYRVTLDREFDLNDREKLLKGIFLDGKRARFKAITFAKGHTIEVVLNQGLKRQIRQQLYKSGYEVERLIRIQFGALKLNQLPSGHFQQLTLKEIGSLESDK